MKSLILPFLILLLLAGCASKPSPNLCPTVCDGLVAYYPFYGDATDKSGNGQDGKVVGASLTKDRNGYQNHAYSFDGADDYVQFENILFGESSFTISVTGKFNSLSDDWNEKSWSRGAISHSHEKSSFWFGYIFYKDGKKNLFFSIREKPDTWAEVITTKINPLEYNVYTGVADKRNNTVLLYVNGQFIGDGKWDGSVFRSSSKWYLGMVGSRSFEKKHGNHLDGQIDEVRVYNRALSADEVKELYLFTSAFPPAE
jgi:hypothetical protein